MPTASDLEFKAERLLSKIKRIHAVGKQFEVEPSDKKKSSLFRVMTRDLENYYSEYLETINKYSAFCAKQTPPVEMDFPDMIEEFETLFYEIQAILFLNENAAGSSENNLQSSNLVTSANHNRVEPRSQGSINLPSLPLVNFDGNPLNWQTFYDVFVGAVHDNSNLPEISKFMYLKSILKGEALSLISSMPVTAANYSIAWAAIQSRYKDDNRLTNAYLETILDFNVVYRDAASLRTFSTMLVEYKGALEALGHVVEDWSVLLLFLLRRKLGGALREKWEKISLELHQSSVQDFVNFLDNEAKVLEAAKNLPVQDKFQKSSAGFNLNRHSGKNSSRNFTALLTTHSDGRGDSHSNCNLCGLSHKNLWNCKGFLSRTVEARFRFAKQNLLCLLCLDGSHLMKECSSSPCTYCKGQHNRLLCFGKPGNRSKIRQNSPRNSPLPTRESDKPMGRPSLGVDPNQNSVPGAAEGGTATTDDNAVQSLASTTINARCAVLLATAQVLIEDKYGNLQTFTAILDSGSQGSFVTEQSVKKLGLKVSKFNIPIYGFGKSDAVKANGLVNITLKSTDPKIEHSTFKVEAIVVNHILTSQECTLSVQDFAKLKGFQLADPEFNKTKAIDLLFGADCFANFVIGSPVKGTSGLPDILPTVFGNCLFGRIRSVQNNPLEVLSITIREDSLDSLIRQFWEIENIPTRTLASAEDTWCEQHYSSTVGRRDKKYVVCLPIRSLAPALGDSYAQTVRRFQLLENRLMKNPELREKYNHFMKDYLDQGHMIEANVPPAEFSYFIPHHCIYKKDGEFSKFRVVFDCSMKTSSGTSLNDILHPGCKLQTDILHILLSFRFNSVVLIADIRQMYRNIQVHESQFDLQRIVWRFDPSEELKQYWLTTLTFGENCAPWLAIRTLHQLIKDHGSRYPAASIAVLNCTWMDDITTSVPSLQEGFELRKQLIDLMAEGGLELRKWQSNRPELLTDLTPETRALDPSLFSFQDPTEVTTAILGLAWNPITDSFSYKLTANWGPVTKRSILSEVARWYDPLGFIAPIVFYGKFVIQHLWRLGLDWDQTPPVEVIEKWQQLRNELPLIAKFEINRNFNLESAIDMELYAFADASERGYCAMIFLRIMYRDHRISIFLLIAKSKVAPIRKVTLPRLELCALVLAAQLVDYARKFLETYCQLSKICVWSDSTVALRWVKSSPHKWKTFIANRISLIQEIISPQYFHYVPTKENPSDIGSRGALPSQFVDNNLLKFGPDWLRQPSEKWPPQKNLDDQNSPDLEVESRVIALITNVERSEIDWILKFSSFSKLRSCVAWWSRFIRNSKHPSNKKTGPLIVEELQSAEIRLVKIVQSREFAEAIRNIEKGYRLSDNLKKLNTFLDPAGLLRVGGRLKNANFSFNEKHPLLLPKGHHLTALIIDFYHLNYLHPGALNLHAIIRRKFWIINGREVIRRRVVKCIKCFRTNPTSQAPLMGELPVSRLTPVNPFSITGVDFGGPFEIKTSTLRTAKTVRGYLCLFVCFSTHAVHLELVSDLSSDAFLAALRRLVARKGAVKELHSDCGTNFVGAHRKLKAWVTSSTPEENPKIRQFLNDQNIKWKFLPPGSPHMGGIWERGIRSVKQHLSRVIGEQRLTFEEFYTVLVQIEGVLNSRPLTPLSSDPNDLEALTPGHFLFQEPVTSIVYVEEHQIKLTRRWELVQQIVASIWKRWRMEYINSLQTRPKWYEHRENLPVGGLVILKEPNMPPCRWPLGRIVRVFPGLDNISRVAEVRTRSGVFRRPVVKVCPLPIEH